MLFKVVGGLLVGLGMVFVLNAGRLPRRYHERRARQFSAAVRRFEAAPRGNPRRRPPSALLEVGAWPFAAARFGVGGVCVAVGALLLVEGTGH